MQLLIRFKDQSTCRYMYDIKICSFSLIFWQLSQTKFNNQNKTHETKTIYKFVLIEPLKRFSNQQYYVKCNVVKFYIM